VGAPSGGVQCDGGEWEGEVAEIIVVAEELPDHGGEPGVGEQVGLRVLQGAGLGEQASGEDLLGGDTSPRVRQTVGGARGIEGDDSPVEAADGGASDEIGRDVVFGERLEHADLHGAEAGAATENEPEGPGEFGERHGASCVLGHGLQRPGR
jgi:hypothetical protein